MMIHNCLWVRKLAELVYASTLALTQSLTQASSHQVENQTCFKIASRKCAICLAAAGSKLWAFCSPTEW